MDTQSIDRLEQLARLRSAGVLSEDEFTAAKSALLRRSSTPASPWSADAPVPNASAGRASGPVAPLSETWQRRFAFMDAYWPPRSPGYMAAYRALPWREKRILVFSPLGFLLGPFYLIYLGLWRPAISIVVSMLVLLLLLEDAGFMGASLERWIATGVGSLCATTCIPLYYLKTVRGVDSWNPFVGLWSQS